jgi:hypothetical protein
MFLFQLFKIMKEHKNHKVLCKGLSWMVTTIEDFSTSHLPLKAKGFTGPVLLKQVMDDLTQPLILNATPTLVALVLVALSKVMNWSFVMNLSSCAV